MSTMDTDEFWNIIDVGKEADDPETVLRTQLEKLSPEQINAFDNTFNNLFDKAYFWDLWGAAYLINGGCSDDGFIDFRYALIGKGEHIYANAMKNPDSLAELGEDLELDNELFGYVAREVYESKTGSDLPMPEDEDEVEEVGMGEEWDFDDEQENRKKLPRLFALYWE